MHHLQCVFVNIQLKALVCDFQHSLACMVVSAGGCHSPHRPDKSDECFFVENQKQSDLASERPPCHFAY